MGLYCTHRFKDEVEKLRKNNSYASIEADIIKQYCKKVFTDWREGDLLFAMPTGTPDALMLKKRLSGSGGFRIYGLAKVKMQSHYLGFAHPKTGPQGKETLNKDEIKAVAGDILTSIKSGNLLTLEVVEDAKAKWKLKFNPIEVEESATK